MKQKVSPRENVRVNPPPPEIFDLTCLLMEEHERDNPNDGYEACCSLWPWTGIKNTSKKLASLHHSEWVANLLYPAIRVIHVYFSR